MWLISNVPTIEHRTIFMDFYKCCTLGAHCSLLNIIPYFDTLLVGCCFHRSFVFFITIIFDYNDILLYYIVYSSCVYVYRWYEHHTQTFRKSDRKWLFYVYIMLMLVWYGTVTDGVYVCVVCLWCLYERFSLFIFSFK